MLVLRHELWHGTCPCEFASASDRWKALPLNEPAALPTLWSAAELRQVSVCRDSQSGIQNVLGALLVSAIFLGKHWPCRAACMLVLLAWSGVRRTCTMHACTTCMTAAGSPLLPDILQKPAVWGHTHVAFVCILELLWDGCWLQARTTPAQCNRLPIFKRLLPLSLAALCTSCSARDAYPWSLESSNLLGSRACKGDAVHSLQLLWPGPAPAEFQASLLRALHHICRNSCQRCMPPLATCRPGTHNCTADLQGANSVLQVGAFLLLALPPAHKADRAACAGSVLAATTQRIPSPWHRSWSRSLTSSCKPPCIGDDQDLHCPSLSRARAELTLACDAAASPTSWPSASLLQLSQASLCVY